jgi:hypothetical protein
MLFLWHMPLLSTTIKILPTWWGKNNGTGDDHGKLTELADSSEIQITLGARYGSHNLDSDEGMAQTGKCTFYLVSLKPGIYHFLLDDHSLPEHKTLWWVIFFKPQTAWEMGLKFCK